MMERLTKPSLRGDRYVSAIGSGCGCWGKIIERLAAYENTGLEPEVVKDMAENAETRLLAWFEARYGMPVGKLMDLIEAKQDGRLMVLPCKVGDMAWIIEDDGIYCVRVQGILASANGKDCILRFGGYPSRAVYGSAVGKTVFLTREEAEKALAKEADK